MMPLHLGSHAANDATAAQSVKFMSLQYAEGGKTPMLSPSASTHARGKNGQRRHKRCASKAGKLTRWQTVQNYSLLQASWRWSPSAVAKVKQNTHFPQQSRCKGTLTSAQQVAR